MPPLLLTWHSEDLCVKHTNTEIKPEKTIWGGGVIKATNRTNINFYVTICIRVERHT